MPLLRGSILVVDNDPAVLDTLFRILGARGYEVYRANSGREALELVEQFPFDLVLMDIVMPGINGVETLREIRSLRPNQDVVMMTAYPDVALVSEARDAGARAVLTKPFHLSELMEWLPNSQDEE